MAYEAGSEKRHRRLCLASCWRWPISLPYIYIVIHTLVSSNATPRSKINPQTSLGINIVAPPRPHPRKNNQTLLTQLIYLNFRRNSQNNPLHPSLLILQRRPMSNTPLLGPPQGSHPPINSKESPSLPLSVSCQKTCLNTHRSPASQRISHCLLERFRNGSG